MKWLALLLCALPRADEEKGTFRLSFHGETAGVESYRIESFDTGSTVLFIESKFSRVVEGKTLRHVVDAVLTADSKFAPIRYAAYHKAGRKERLSKLTWKGGLVSDGRKRLKSRATFVLDRFVVAQYLPILCRGAGTFLAFDPAGRNDVEVRIEEGPETALRSDEKAVAVRELRIRKGADSLTAHVDAEGALIRLEDSATGMLAEREGFEGMTPGPLDPVPEGIEESEVRFPRGEDSASAALIRPAAKGPHPAVVLVGGGKADVACGAGEGGAKLLRAVARKLAASGVLALETEASDVEAAVCWLRARDDVSSVALLGHGEGGRAAAAQAVRDEDIRRLILLSPVIRPLEEILLDRLERRLEGQGIQAEIRRELVGRQRALFASVREAEGDYLQIDERRTFIGSLRERLEFDLGDTLDGVKVPIAVFQGGKDGCAGPADAERLGRAVPHAKTYRFEGLGHHFGGPVDEMFLEKLADLIHPGTPSE